MTQRQFDQWTEDRARQAAQHPGPSINGSRGDHYRRKNNGIALRTFRAIMGRR
jgi:hypothetical protein